MGTITLPIDEADRLADVVAGLMRQGLRFSVVTNEYNYLIEITGH